MLSLLFIVTLTTSAINFTSPEKPQVNKVQIQDKLETIQVKLVGTSTSNPKI